MNAILLCLALVCTASFAHHEPVNIFSLTGRNTRIQIDHHGLSPAFIWFRSDVNVPIQPLYMSQTKWVTLLVSYMLIDYANRPFSIRVIYKEGYSRTIRFEPDGESTDVFAPP